MRSEVLAGLVPREGVYSAGGILLGQAPGIRFKRERVYPSLEKMVLGLYFYHTGKLLPRDVKFRWVEAHKLHFGRFPEYFQAATDGLAYDDVFECRYLGVREGDREGSLWWLRFYRATIFHCFVITSRDGTVEDHGP